jgi:hypothetical protein
MKALTFIITLIFAFSALADSGAQMALEQSFDEYQYVVITEWDQKDPEFVNGALKKMKSDVKVLVEKNKLTLSDLISVLEKRMKNKEEFEAVKLRLNLLASEKNPAATLDLVQEELKKSFSSGASWNGVVLDQIGGWTLVLGFLAIGVYLIADPGGKCIEQADYIDCDDLGNDCKTVTRCKTYQD